MGKKTAKQNEKADKKLPPKKDNKKNAKALKTKKPRSDNKQQKKKNKNNKKLTKRNFKGNSLSKSNESKSNESEKSEDNRDLKPNNEGNINENSNKDEGDKPGDVEYVRVGCEICNVVDEVRLILRQCGHVTCIPCIIEHLKNEILISGKGRIKCLVNGCLSFIHDNDVNAVLDEKEATLEIYMSIQHRRYLQYKYNKHLIGEALSEKQIKYCPYCKCPYTHEEGCNYVVCANNACNTKFCWTCAKPIGRPVSHFTYASDCRLGFADYSNLLSSVQIILNLNIIILMLFVPFMYLLAFLYVPIIILFAVPISIAHRVWSQAHSTSDYLTIQEYVLIVIKIIVYVLFSPAVSVPITLGSIISGNVIMAVYWGIVFIKMCCCGCIGDKISMTLTVLKWCGRIFRVGPYGTLLNEAKREQKALKIKRQDEEALQAIQSEANNSNASVKNVDETGINIAF